MPKNKHARSTVVADDAQRFMDVAFSRNLGILTPEEQYKLGRARVAVPGLGGVGGLHCLTLARTGLGGFHLADPDTFELVNCNRQFGATMPRLGQGKLEVMAEEIRKINPHAVITPFPVGLTAENLDAFLLDIDIVVDSLDFFAFGIRRALFNRSRQLGITVVTAAPLGFTSSTLVFTPQSMSFDDYFDIHDGLSERECLLRFAVGLAPRGLHLGQMDPSRVSLDSGQGPSLAIACLLCAALAATETVRRITGRPGLRATPWSLQVDALSGRSRRVRLRRGNASGMQRAKLWYVRNILLGGEGSGLRPKPAPPEPAPETATAPPAYLAWLAQAAQQAPSGDNCQPWTFRLGDGRLHLFIAPDSDRSFFNVRQRASLIACGAAVQNVVSAAPGLGWAADPVLLPNPDDENHVATVRFTPWPGQADPLGEAVWSRCTNRRPYDRRRVSGYDQEQLVRAAEPAVLLLLEDAPRLRELGRLLYHADRIRVERRDLHEHLMGMIRFDNAADTPADDGLPLRNLYAGVGGNLFLRLTRSWPVMDAANRLGIGRLAAIHSRLTMARSPLAGLLCLPSPSRADFLAAGMALERVWLTATRLGLAVQPMTAITLFWVRWKLEGPGDFSRRHQRLLEPVWRGFEALFPALGRDCWPAMLFRAGHAPAVRHGTPRKPLFDALAS